MNCNRRHCSDDNRLTGRHQYGTMSELSPLSVERAMSKSSSHDWKSEDAKSEATFLLIAKHLKRLMRPSRCSRSTGLEGRFQCTIFAVRKCKITVTRKKGKTICAFFLSNSAKLIGLTSGAFWIMSATLGNSSKLDCARSNCRAQPKKSRKGAFIERKQIYRKFL